MRHSDQEVQQRWGAATRWACAAGRLTLEYFHRRDLIVDSKADSTPVTAADRAVEQFLRKEIMTAFPEDAILGEEFGSQSGHSGWRWILDPIDGTKSFIHGVPLYGTLVGVGRCDPNDTTGHSYEPIIGVAVIPASMPGGECVTAANGAGAWYLCGDAEPVAAHVSKVHRLGEACFSTSEAKFFSLTGHRETYHRIEESVRLVMTWGDAFGYVQVALGREEIMADAELSVWDAAAVLPIIVEAGGRFTDWQGNVRIDSGTAVATNGLLHDEFLKMLTVVHHS